MFYNDPRVRYIYGFGLLEHVDLFLFSTNKKGIRESLIRFYLQVFIFKRFLTVYTDLYSTPKKGES